MRSKTSMISARRTRRHAERRARRRPAILSGGLALGVLATVAMTGTAPMPPVAASATPVSFSLASYESAAAGFEAAPAGEIAGAREAATAADTALAAAAAITADIAASGLDIGEPDTSIDTSPLETAAERLDAVDALPVPLIPAVTADVTELVASVDTRVSQLRGSLDGALARKAEEEAAEKARLEAAAAAQAAAAAKAATPSAPRPAAAPMPAGGGGSGDNSPAGAQATARGMLAGYGWGDDQFSCLVSLWQKESGWNYQAQNRSSGAYGIPQALPGSKMGSAGADWATNAATQIAWGFGYISGRYGSPCGAWSHSQSVGWY